MGNLDLNYGHMSTEGSLAFHYNEWHAYSLRGSITVGAGVTPAPPRLRNLPIQTNYVRGQYDHASWGIEELAFVLGVIHQIDQV